MRSDSIRRRVRKLTDRLTSGERAGTERVRIDDLISPLRYDVLVRQKFFELLASLPPEDRDNLAAVAEIARDTPYFTWFRSIVVPRFKPELVGREDAIGNAFVERVQLSIDLYDSLGTSGYSRQWPITLFSGREILPTDTGKQLDRRLYAGDGCHRLALLRSSGVEVLDPGDYRLLVARRMTPLDNTTRLIPLLGIESERYFTFMALSYAPGHACRTEGQLLEQVRSEDPDRLPELRAILRRDLQLLSDT